VAWAAALGALLALAGAVLWRARGLKRRHRAVLGAPLPPLDPGAQTLFASESALHHGTRFADGAAFLAWAPGVVDLSCTAQALFVGTLVVPLDFIEDVALVRDRAAMVDRELPMLRVRWRRGGEALVTDLSLKGGMAQLERLRRELHLRQGGGDMAARLSRWLEAPP